MPRTKKLNANQKIKRQMALWERRVRDAIRRASERGETWYFREAYAYHSPYSDKPPRRDYWSSSYSAKKAADRLEKRGTIKFFVLRRRGGRYRSGYIYKGYGPSPSRRKVVKT